MYFYSGDECQATQKKKELRNTHDTKTTLGYKSLLLGMQNTPKSISHQFFCCKIFKFISCTHVLRLAYENPKKKKYFVFEFHFMQRTLQFFQKILSATVSDIICIYFQAIKWNKWNWLLCTTTSAMQIQEPVWIILLQME